MTCLILWALLFQAAPPKPAPPPTEIEEDAVEQLAKVRRVYVDLLTGGESALKLRDLLMSSLQTSKLIVTEDEDRADAVIKGAAEDTVFTQFFSSSEGLNAHSQISTPGSESTSNSRLSGRSLASMGVGETESHRSEERKHEALATIRLVAKDGDVIWSTTQESFGGKFLGASADVADKIAKKLAGDIARAKRQAKSEVKPAQ